MQELTAYCGTQLTLSHAFNDLTHPAAAAAATGVRFRIWGPGAALVLDTALTGELPEGVTPGQLLPDSASRYTLLWSIPSTADRGYYAVQITATLEGGSIDEDVARIWVREPQQLSLSLLVQDPSADVESYRCFFRVTEPTELRLLRELVIMARADKVRWTPGPISATARYEDGKVEDLLERSSYTLLPGWTQVEVSASLFMLPAVDRLYQAVGYGGSGDRYANPYWRDGLVYDFGDAKGQSPLADATRFGPGPLFYLYLSDPHWGCHDFKVRWEQNGRLKADPTSPTVLSGTDPRRLALVCRPDFAPIVHASRDPLALVCPEALRRRYSAALDGGRIWLRGAMNGPGSTHPIFAPEFAAGGPSDYYRLGVEATRRDWPEGSTDRFMTQEEKK